MARDEQLLVVGIQIAVSLLTAIATCWVALAVGRGQKRSSSDSQEILAVLARFAQGQRRDEIVRLLERERDPGYLQQLALEAEAMDGLSRNQVLGAYHRNPATRLPTHPWPGDVVAGAVLDSLQSRYGEVRIDTELRELAEFASQCHHNGINPWRAVEVLVKPSTGGLELSSFSLSTFFNALRPDELAFDASSQLLSSLAYMHDPEAWPYLEVLHAAAASSVKRIASVAISDRGRRELCTAIATAARGSRLVRLAECHSSSSVFPDECLVELIDLFSHVAGIDRHLDMRSLEGLLPVIRAFPSLDSALGERLCSAWARAVSALGKTSGTRTGQYAIQFEQEVRRLANCDPSP